MKKKGTQIVALFALLGIIASVIGTGLLVIINNNSNKEVELTQEQIEQINQMIKNNSGSLKTGTGESLEIK